MAANRETVNRRLAKIIVDSGMSSSDIAIACGMGAATVCDARKGKTVSMENVTKLADFFSVSLDYLYGRVNEKDTDRFFEDRKLFLQNVYTRRAIIDRNIRKKLGREKWDYDFRERTWKKCDPKESPYFTERIDSFVDKVEAEYAPYPENLLINVFDKTEYDVFDKRETRFLPVDKDVRDGIDYVLSKLTERERQVIKFRYEDMMTLGDVGRELSLTNERIRQIEAKALRKMRQPINAGYLLYGIHGYGIRMRRNAAERELRKATEAERRAKELYAEAEKLTGEGKKQAAMKLYTEEEIADTTIDELELSVRSYNALKRNGISTVLELRNLIEKDGEDALKKIRNLGVKSQREVLLAYYNFSKGETA